MTLRAGENMIKRTIAVAIFILIIIGSGISEEVNAKKVILNTNLAYLGMSAFMTSSQGAFIAIPLEAQIKISNYLSIIPCATIMYYANNKTSYSELILMGEIEVAYMSKPNMNGWMIGLLPGIEYSIDSKKMGISIGTEIGYQWNIGEMLMLGVSGGVREIFMDGNITLPDLKARIGIRL
jgi:hypothetical protein